MLGTTIPVTALGEIAIDTEETHPPSLENSDTIIPQETVGDDPTSSATENLLTSSTTAGGSITDGVYKIKDTVSGLYLDVVNGGV